MWTFRDESGFESGEKAALERQLCARKMLDELLHWAFAQSPPLQLSDVIVQDEFTHDVVLTRPDRRALVFDCT